MANLGQRIVSLTMIVVLASLFFSLQHTVAQGTFLAHGESGIGTSGGFFFNDNSSGFGVDLGYSVVGILDVGFGVGRAKVDEEEYDSDISVTVFAPSLGVHLLKQTEEIPISFSIGAGYSKGTYSAEELDALDLDMTASGWTISGSLYGKLPISPESQLVPQLGISHTSLEVKLKDRFGDSISNDNGSTSFNIGIDFAFLLPSQSTFYVSPSLSFGEDTTTFGVDVGFVFNTTPKTTTKPARWTERREVGRTRPPYQVDHPGPVAAPSVNPAHDTSADQSMVQAKADRIPEEMLLAMRGETPTLTTASAEMLKPEQVTVIGQVFKVLPASIKTFRWGKSMAPAGHPHAGSTWYRIESGEELYRATETIRISATGVVTERSKR